MQANSATQRNYGFVNEVSETSSGVRALQNAVLSELPGVAFAVLTLVYLFTSLVRL
jgi:hypothetical protein